MSEVRHKAFRLRFSCIIGLGHLKGDSNINFIVGIGKKVCEVLFPRFLDDYESRLEDEIRENVISSNLCNRSEVT